MREEEEFVPDYSGGIQGGQRCAWLSARADKACNFCTLTGKLRGCPPGKTCKHRQFGGVRDGEIRWDGI